MSLLARIIDQHKTLLNLVKVIKDYKSLSKEHKTEFWGAMKVSLLFDVVICSVLLNVFYWFVMDEVNIPKDSFWLVAVGAILYVWWYSFANDLKEYRTLKRLQ